METERLLIENPSFRAWWRLARAYHSAAGRLTHFFEKHGITGAQFGVLRCVNDAGDAGLMLSDLSRRLMVTGANITGVVDRLEQAGYLRRERLQGDRRVVLAHLTPEGRAFYRELLPRHQEFVREVMGSLSVEETESLTRICEHLHCALEEKRTSAADCAVVSE